MSNSEYKVFGEITAGDALIRYNGLLSTMS